MTDDARGADQVPDELRALAGEVTNWGRWGPDDERGTLNLITADHRARAAALVTEGRHLSLSLPFDEHGPMSGLIGRHNPVHTMTATGLDATQKMDMGGGARFTDDYIAMPLQCATHWDALAHLYYDDQLYNGYPSSAVDALGAHRCSVDRTHDAFVGRAVLLDLARHRGVDALAPDTAVGPDELEAVARSQGVAVGQGDIVLIRTGLMGTRARTGTWDAFAGMQPGLHYECARWLRERDVAAVAADNAAVEHLGLSMPGVLLPFHMLALRDMGLSLGEYFVLEELAGACQELGRWEAFMVAAPLRVSGAVGAPANPVVVL
jgi:kynurenine formamidase